MTFKDNIRGLSLVVDDATISTISQQAISAYPNETGGFLVGKYSDDQKVAMVSQTLLPVECKSGPSSFRRETNGMEKTWDDLYKQGLIYLGEWHSHPDGNAHYSLIDKQAMINIATCDTVVINHPIMLIVSISKTKLRGLKAYYYKKDKLIEYEPH